MEAGDRLGRERRMIRPLASGPSPETKGLVRFGWIPASLAKRIRTPFSRSLLVLELLEARLVHPGVHGCGDDVHAQEDAPNGHDRHDVPLACPDPADNESQQSSETAAEQEHDASDPQTG